jgi:hypothetical protein
VRREVCQPRVEGAGRSWTGCGSSPHERPARKIIRRAAIRQSRQTALAGHADTRRRREAIGNEVNGRTTGEASDRLEAGMPTGPGSDRAATASRLAGGDARGLTERAVSMTPSNGRAGVLARRGDELVSCCVVVNGMNGPGRVVELANFEVGSARVGPPLPPR